MFDSSVTQEAAARAAEDERAAAEAAKAFAAEMLRGKSRARMSGAWRSISVGLTMFMGY